VWYHRQRRPEFEDVAIADEQNIEVAQKQLMQQLEGKNGYRIDPKLFAETAGLKLSSDGRNVLIPRPNDDPNNPLNWTHEKKALILLSLQPASSQIMAVLPETSHSFPNPSMNPLRI
jgi:hypothetical protein